MDKQVLVNSRRVPVFVLQRVHRLEVYARTDGGESAGEFRFDAENGYKQGMHGLGNTLGYLWLLTLYLLENNEPTFAVMKANGNEELTGMN